MRKNPIRPRVIAAAAVAFTLMLGLPAVAGTAGASTPLAGSAAGLAWAYGAHANSTVSGSGGNGAYVYTFHAFFGWDTILTQTNTSATTFQLEAQRTMASSFYLTECRPTCTAPVGNLSITYHAWESAAGFGNFTSAGTVYESGTAVPAYAMSDGAYSVRANVSASGNSTYRGLLSTLQGSFDSSVSASAHAAIAFSPALGLYPTTPAIGETWNATSNYTSTGGWAWSYAFHQDRLDGVVLSYSNQSAGNLTGSGTVELSGADGGSVDLNGGLLTHAIRLATDADFPFHFGDGVLFVPGATDVFGDSGQAWQDPQPGNTSAETNSLNVAPGPAGHFPLFATATTYAPSSNSSAPSSPTSIAGTAGPAPGGLALLASADGPAPSTLQAQPETISAAQGNMNCLTAGDCPTVGPATPGHGPGLFELAVLGAAVAAVAATVFAVVERRREGPPAHPNARLYPPRGGAPPPARGSAPTAPPRGAVQGRTPDDGEPDPLGHLW